MIRLALLSEPFQRAFRSGKLAETNVRRRATMLANRALLGSSVPLAMLHRGVSFTSTGRSRDYTALDISTHIERHGRSAWEERAKELAEVLEVFEELVAQSAPLSWSGGTSDEAYEWEKAAAKCLRLARWALRREE